MTVHTRQVIAASRYEGNSGKPKTTIEGKVLRGGAAAKLNRSKIMDRLRPRLQFTCAKRAGGQGSKLVQLAQSFFESFPHNEKPS